MSEELNIMHDYNEETKEWETIGAGYVANSDGSNKYAPNDIKAMDDKLAGIADGANKYVHPGYGTNPHGTTKTDVGLGNVDNVKQMPMSGGTFTGIAVAQSNASYTTRQVHNIILSTADADVNAMQNGDIWIKYK